MLVDVTVLNPTGPKFKNLLKEKPDQDVKPHSGAAVTAIEKFRNDMKDGDGKKVRTSENQQKLKVFLPKRWKNEHQ